MLAVVQLQQSLFNFRFSSQCQILFSAQQKSPPSLVSRHTNCPICGEPGTRTVWNPTRCRLPHEKIKIFSLLTAENIIPPLLTALLKFSVRSRPLLVRLSIIRAYLFLFDASCNFFSPPFFLMDCSMGRGEERRGSADSPPSFAQCFMRF